MYSYMNIKYNCKYFYFLMNIGLIKVYTMRDIKHKTDRPRGIVNNNAGIIISVLFSLSLQ